MAAAARTSSSTTCSTRSQPVSCRHRASSLLPCWPGLGDLGWHRTTSEAGLGGTVMKRFDNRTVIVTGGARGMGTSHARGFLAEGANVVIADVLEQEGRTLAEELGNHAIF